MTSQMDNLDGRPLGGPPDMINERVEALGLVVEWALERAQFIDGHTRRGERLLREATRLGIDIDEIKRGLNDAVVAQFISRGLQRARGPLAEEAIEDLFARRPTETEPTQH